jgi:hypothetical protein
MRLAFTPADVDPAGEDRAAGRHLPSDLDVRALERARDGDRSAHLGPAGEMERAAHVELPADLDPVAGAVAVDLPDPADLERAEREVAGGGEHPADLDALALGAARELRDPADLERAELERCARVEPAADLDGGADGAALHVRRPADLEPVDVDVADLDLAGRQLAGQLDAAADGHAVRVDRRAPFERASDLELLRRPDGARDVQPSIDVDLSRRQAAPDLDGAVARLEALPHDDVRAERRLPVVDPERLALERADERRVARAADRAPDDQTALRLDADLLADDQVSLDGPQPDGAPAGDSVLAHVPASAGGPIGVRHRS